MLQHLLSLCLLASAPAWQIDDPDRGWNEESLAQTYFHHSELQRQWAWELLASHPFTGEERVLDFGCGDGKLSTEISHFVARGAVTGVDLSSAMVAFANRRFPSEFYPNLSFTRTADVTGALPGLDQEFDLICSFCVFHVLPDPTLVLSNLRNHLSPEGKLLAVYPTGKNLAFFEAATETFHAFEMEAPWERGPTGPTKRAMRTLEGSAEVFASAGWTIETIREIHRPNAFYNRQELIDWLLGTTVANWGIPLEIAPSFFGQLLDRMVELDTDVIQPDGSYHFKLSRIHVAAST